MRVPTLPSGSERPARWFRIGTEILGPVGTLLLFLAAPLATTPAAADCLDYGQYWHVVSRIECGNGGLNVVAGNYAFVLEGCSYGEAVYFNVIDVRDPANPVRLVRFPTEQETGVAMAMSGTHVYCLEGYYDFRCLQIIDVSDPLNPAIDATLETPYGNLADIAVSGDHVFIAAYPDIIVVDVSDPGKPVVVGGFPVPGVATSIEVFGHYLGIGVRVVYGEDPAPAGLYVVDVSDPGSPLRVGFIHTDEAGPREFAITGDYAYLTTPWYGGSSTLHVIDLSDPAEPSIVCRLPAGDNIEGIILSDTLGYVSQYGGVQVVDISDPRQPRFGAVLQGVGGSGSLSGDHLYLGGLAIVDVQNPITPGPLSRLDLDGGIGQAIARGQYAYLVGGWYWNGWLQILDMADPLHPRVVGSTDLRGNSLALDGSSAYVTIRDWGLAEIDVSDPRNPTPLCGIQLPGPPVDLAVSHGIAYVALESAGLAVIDCNQDPWWLIGVMDTPGSAYALALSGSYLYIADYTAGVQVVDVSTPWYPRIIANVPCGGTWDLAVSGHNLYVAGLDTYVIDISVPTAPQLVSTHCTNCAAYPRVEVRGSIVYSSVSGGVEVLDGSDSGHLSILGFISGAYAIGVDPEGEWVYSNRADPLDPDLYLFWGQCTPATAVDDGDGSAVSGAGGPGLEISPNPTLRGRPTRIRWGTGATSAAIDVLPDSPSSALEVSIYDVAGRRVRKLREAGLHSGPPEVIWDGFDAKGHRVPSGVYMVRAARAGSTRSAKIVIAN